MMVHCLCFRFKVSCVRCLPEVLERETEKKKVKSSSSRTLDKREYLMIIFLIPH